MEKELKPDQLSILCEVPLKVQIGDKEFKVYPLTLKKMKLLEPHASAIFEKVGGFTVGTDGSVSAQEIIKSILSNLSGIMEEMIKLVQILLKAKIGDEDLVTKEFLEENLDTLTLGTILGFVIKAANIGETVKNVVILQGMAK